MASTTSPAPPKPDDPLLADLISDAKIVALYGQRAGLLADAALQQAIFAVENLAHKSWRDQAVVDLQIALNKTMRDLSPTTLQDLKGPSAPFVRSMGLATQILAFVIFSIILVVAAAWFTLSYNHGTALVVSIEKLEETNARNRISELARQIVANAGSTDIDAQKESAAAEAYLGKLEEMRSLDEQTSVQVGSADTYIQQNFFISQLMLKGPVEAWHLLARDVGGGVQGLRQQPDICDQQEKSPPQDPSANSDFGVTRMAILIRSQVVQGISVTCMNRLKYHLFDFPVLERYVSDLGSIVNVYGLWILPALYGSLGAAMFLMRRVLNPILPNPSALRILHRVTVGAFAGIIIAWFWAPSAQSNRDFQNIGVNLFAVAFLVGYSIDVFFALLDRLVASVTGSIGRMGTTQP